jgi:hypothetical protein
MASEPALKWTPIMLVLSLIAFFSAVALLGRDGSSVSATQNQAALILFFFLLIISLVLSWGAFVNSIRQFRYYDDKRWAWFYCIISDLTATLMTVAGLYSIFSVLAVLVK